MKKKIFLQLGFLLLANFTFAQSIGVGTATPSQSALLELSSSEKGFLPPRLDSIQRNNIVSPATGLMIYNTLSNGPEYYNGTSWVSITTVKQINKALIAVGPVGNVQYWVVSYDGTNQTQITIPTLPIGLSVYNGTPPSLSPDGNKIFFFVVKLSDLNYGAFYSCNIDGTNLLKVFERNIDYNNFQFGGAY